MDTLSIKFIINSFFLEESSGAPILENTVITRPIPKQLNNDGKPSILIFNSILCYAGI